MSTTRPIVILLDTHRAWLVDTEAANDVEPRFDRTFAPPKPRVSWANVCVWAVIAAAVIAFWTMVTVEVHRLLGA